MVTMCTKILILLLFGLTMAQMPKEFLQELKKVKSAKQFIQKFISNMTTIDIPVSWNKTDSEKEIITNGTRYIPVAVDTVSNVLANQAGCEPREVEVEVPRDDDPKVISWPTCTKVMRCGGCCGSEMLECAPKPEVGFARTKIKILRAKYPYVGATYFEFQSIAEVYIHKHLECECRCKVQMHHCTAKQEYVENECRCKCKNDHMRGQCPRTKKWSEQSCGCVCKKTFKCLSYEDFDDDTCRCVFKKFVRQENNIEIIIPVPVVATTTVPPSKVPVLNQECRYQRCPQGTIRFQNPISGNCECKIPTQAEQEGKSDIETIDMGDYGAIDTETDDEKEYDFGDMY